MAQMGKKSDVSEEQKQDVSEEQKQNEYSKGLRLYIGYLRARYIHHDYEPEQQYASPDVPLG